MLQNVRKLNVKRDKTSEYSKFGNLFKMNVTLELGISFCVSCMCVCDVYWSIRLVSSIKTTAFLVSVKNMKILYAYACIIQ